MVEAARVIARVTRVGWGTVTDLVDLVGAVIERVVNREAGVTALEREVGGFRVSEGLALLDMV